MICYSRIILILFMFLFPIRSLLLRVHTIRTYIININHILSSYSVHFYGKLSQNFKQTHKIKSIFIKLAYENCKNVYDYVEKSSILFE